LILTATLAVAECEVGHVCGDHLTQGAVTAVDQVGAARHQHRTGRLCLRGIDARAAVRAEQDQLRACIHRVRGRVWHGLRQHACGMQSGPGGTDRERHQS